MVSSQRELLSAAERIRELAAGDEALERAAVSRYYYAALNAVGVTFPAQRPRRDREGSHDYIISQARHYAQTPINAGRAEAAAIAALMVEIKPLRVVADYTVTSDLPPTVSSTMIAKVERIFELCALVESARQAASSA